MVSSLLPCLLDTLDSMQIVLYLPRRNPRSPLFEVSAQADGMILRAHAAFQGNFRKVLQPTGLDIASLPRSTRDSSADHSPSGTVLLSFHVVKKLEKKKRKKEKKNLFIASNIWCNFGERESRYWLAIVNVIRGLVLISPGKNLPFRPSS